jgi:hypothetical protein
VSSRPGRSASEIQWHYLEVVRSVRQAIAIPLAVKLSPYFSSLANLAGQLAEAGADGLPARLDGPPPLDGSPKDLQRRRPMTHPVVAHPATVQAPRTRNDRVRSLTRPTLRPARITTAML